MPHSLQHFLTPAKLGSSPCGLALSHLHKGPLCSPGAPSQAHATGRNNLQCKLQHLAKSTQQHSAGAIFDTAQDMHQEKWGNKQTVSPNNSDIFIGELKSRYLKEGCRDGTGCICSGREGRMVCSQEHTYHEHSAQQTHPCWIVLSASLIIKQ